MPHGITPRCSFSLPNTTEDTAVIIEIYNTATERVKLLMINGRVMQKYLNFTSKNALELLSLSHKQI